VIRSAGRDTRDEVQGYIGHDLQDAPAAFYFCHTCPQTCCLGTIFCPRRVHATSALHFASVGTMAGTDRIVLGTICLLLRKYDNVKFKIGNLTLMTCTVPK
jgi:hypothetical protein